MSRTPKKTTSDLNAELIQEICVDFIVNEKTRIELENKYHVSAAALKEIIERFELVERRDEYQNQVLDKALTRCSKYQSEIIYKATEILHNHVVQVSELQKSQKYNILSSSEIRDIMAILSIISKENRLDNEHPTERTVGTVEVEFAGGYQGVQVRDVVNIEQEEEIPEAETKQIEPPQPEEDEDDVEVEFDDEIGGGLID